MKYPGQKTRIAVRVRSLFGAALLFVFGTVTALAAQTVTPPPTPTLITPPQGSVAFLVGHAVGTQGYICLPAPTGGTSWTVINPRPEATLFTKVFGQPLQIITHFLSLNENPNTPDPVPPGGNATWQSSFDSSRVWAVPVGMIPAGSDPDSCPNADSIPCLLLHSVGNLMGPTGGQLLAHTTFVQRLNTNGGAAPTTACTVGQTQLVPYTADYYFFHGHQ
jgi:Protein of unknown function (DUF3455)